MSQKIYMPVDSDELIALRDLGYILENEIGNREAIATALRRLISDAYKREYELDENAEGVRD